MKLAGNVARKELISLGTCFGKFTASQKFKLHITALDFIAPYAKVSFIYRNLNFTSQLLISNEILYTAKHFCSCDSMLLLSVWSSNNTPFYFPFR